MVPGMIRQPGGCSLVGSPHGFITSSLSLCLKTAISRGTSKELRKTDKNVLLKPPCVQSLITETLPGFLYSDFCSVFSVWTLPGFLYSDFSLVLWRDVMTASSVQSSPAVSREGAERNSKTLKHRSTYGGLEICRIYLIICGASGQGAMCTPARDERVPLP